MLTGEIALKNNHYYYYFLPVTAFIGAVDFVEPIFNGKVVSALKFTPGSDLLMLRPFFLKLYVAAIFPIFCRAGRGPDVGSVTSK